VWGEWWRKKDQLVLLPVLETNYCFGDKTVLVIMKKQIEIYFENSAVGQWYSTCLASQDPGFHLQH
jgi:hypothetical protein